MDHVINADTGRSRGQVLLVTTFGIAVLLVILTVVVNASAFTQMMATTSDDPSRDAIDFTVAASDGVGGAMDYANENEDASSAALEAEFTQSVADWNDRARDHTARRGARTDVSVLETTYETRIAQTDDNRDFRNVSSADDWTPATDVAVVRDARLNVSTSSLKDANWDADASTLASQGVFQVVIEDADGDTWQMFVFQNNSDVYVRAQGVNCGPVSVPANQLVTIDLVDATVDGTTCSQLDDFETLDSPYSIEYRSASNVVGSYTMLVEHSASGIDESDYSLDGTSDPTIDPRLTDATVQVSYVTADVEYVTTTTVQAGGGS